MGWKANRLRDKARKLVQKGKLDDAAKAYSELRKIEPDEPRWPHKQADVYKRLDKTALAIRAYEDAVDAYAEKGFLARAIAMAKVILQLDPARTDILARVDPSAGQRLRKKKGSGLYDAKQLLAQAAEAIPSTAPSNDPEQAEKAILDSAATPVAEVSDTEDGVAEPSETEILVSDESASVFVVAQPLTPMVDDDELLVFDDAEVTNLSLSERELGEEDDSTNQSLVPDALELAALPAMPLFADIPAAALHSLVQNAELIQFEPGDVALDEHAPADALFVLVEGEAKVVSTSLATPIVLREGEVFGESCLVPGGARQASVVAHTEVSALRISKDTLDALCTGYPQLRDVLLELLTRRLVSNIMTTSTIFRDLPKSVQRSLATSFELRTAEAGLPLIKKDKRADGLYLLLSGTLELIDAKLGIAQELHPGALIGGYSLLRKSGSLHEVVTKSNVIVLRLSATRFRMAVIENQSAVDHLQALAQQSPDPAHPALAT